MPMSRCIWIALVLFLVTPVQGLAQESLESKVRTLEETVQLLERRVTSLEAELREQSAPASVPSGKENWRKLQHGMSPDDVEMLLGSPEKVHSTSVTITWYYPSGGHVRFDTRSRKLEAWREP